MSVKTIEGLPITEIQDDETPDGAIYRLGHVAGITGRPQDPPPGLSPTFRVLWEIAWCDGAEARDGK